MADISQEWVNDLLGVGRRRTVTTYEELEAALHEADVSLGGDPDLAYDGSSAQQLRDLTARERDVLCRVLRMVIRDERYMAEEIGRLQLIAHVIDPRREDG